MAQRLAVVADGQPARDSMRAASSAALTCAAAGWARRGEGEVRPACARRRGSRRAQAAAGPAGPRPPKSRRRLRRCRCPLPLGRGGGRRGRRRSAGVVACAAARALALADAVVGFAVGEDRPEVAQDGLGGHARPVAVAQPWSRSRREHQQVALAWRRMPGPGARRGRSAARRGRARCRGRRRCRRRRRRVCARRSTAPSGRPASRRRVRRRPRRRLRRRARVGWGRVTISRQAR